MRSCDSSWVRASVGVGEGGEMWSRANSWAKASTGSDQGMYLGDRAGNVSTSMPVRERMMPGRRAALFYVHAVRAILDSPRRAALGPAAGGTERRPPRRGWSRTPAALRTDAPGLVPAPLPVASRCNME